EFKRDISSPKNIIKTLVAFANTAGGRLLIGVEDVTKNIIGVQDPLDEEERLCSIIADHIAPRLVPDVELMTVESKTLLVVEVYPSGSRPHWVKSEGHLDGVYVRLGSTNRKADRELSLSFREVLQAFHLMRCQCLICPPVTLILMLLKNALKESGS
ncbi:MAG TPA: putative DNA binding domain-containing protein, partial [Methanomethylovorans sp.]|nr:putative DNA binding domain-containing protein [Methanomethylovorans sp.]